MGGWERHRAKKTDGRKKEGSVYERKEGRTAAFMKREREGRMEGRDKDYIGRKDDRKEGRMEGTTDWWADMIDGKKS